MNSASTTGTDAIFSDGEVGSADSGVRYLVLTTACLLAVMTYVQRVGFAVAGPRITADLGLDQRQWGDVMAAFLLAYGLFEIPLGAQGDRVGVRRLLVALVLGWSLVTAMVALVGRPFSSFLPVSAFFTLMTLRFVFGAFQAGIFPAVSRITADWMPATERGRAQGLIWMSSRFGGAIVPFLMVWLIAFCGTWRTPFLILGGLGVLWVAAFLPWFRDLPEESSLVSAAELKIIREGRGARAAGHSAVPWRRMLGSLSVWSISLMYGFYAFSANFFITLLPKYLKTSRGFSDEQMQWMTGLPLACGMGACVTGGFVSDWFIRRTGNKTWGRRITGMVGLFLAGAAMLSTVWVRDPILLGALLCTTFFCNDLTLGPAWASCADIGERHAGTLGGTMNMIGSYTGALGAMFAGRLFEAGFPKLVFVIFACSYVVSSLCWLGVDVNKTLGDDGRKPSTLTE